MSGSGPGRDGAKTAPSPRPTSSLPGGLPPRLSRPLLQALLEAGAFVQQPSLLFHRRRAEAVELLVDGPDPHGRAQKLMPIGIRSDL